MIYDHLSSLDVYKGLHPNLDLALAAIQDQPLDELDLGRYELDGDKAFFMIQDNTLDKEIGPEFEVHRNYLDLHFLLDGQEIVKYGFGDRKVGKVFDPSIDFGTEICENQLELAINRDYFAIFFPGEAHRPNVFAGQGDSVKKCVVKVLID